MNNKDPWKLFRRKDDDLRQWFYCRVDSGYKVVPMLRQAIEAYRQVLRIFGPNWRQVLISLEFNEADAIIRAKGTELE